MRRIILGLILAVIMFLIVTAISAILNRDFYELMTCYLVGVTAAIMLDSHTHEGKR